jgi:hypothetical protein
MLRLRVLLFIAITLGSPIAFSFCGLPQHKPICSSRMRMALASELLHSLARSTRSLGVPEGRLYRFYIGASPARPIPYRIHPDGTGLDRLTDDPAYDDQGAFSPDGKSPRRQGQAASQVDLTASFDKLQRSAHCRIQATQFPDTCREFLFALSASIRPSFFPTGIQ